MSIIRELLFSQSNIHDIFKLTHRQIKIQSAVFNYALRALGKIVLYCMVNQYTGNIKGEPAPLIKMINNNLGFAPSFY
jgi:hypothetical protein